MLRIYSLQLFLGIGGRGDEVSASDELLMVARVREFDILTELPPPMIDEMPLMATLFTERCQFPLQLLLGGLLFLDDFCQFSHPTLVKTAHTAQALLQPHHPPLQLLMIPLPIQRFAVLLALLLPRVGRKQIVLVLARRCHLNLQYNDYIYCSQSVTYFSLADGGGRAGAGREG